MTDIIVTVPKDQYDQMVEKAQILHERGDVWWDLGRIPRKLHYGERIFFVMNNKISMMARVLIVDADEIHKDFCRIHFRDLVEFIVKPDYNGFRGFRYIDIKEFTWGI